MATTQTAYFTGSSLVSWFRVAIPLEREQVGPGYKFRDEIEGAGDYSRGTLAMANSGPHTNGSQFFITHGDAGLPHSYTIFGKVTDGLDVVDSIAASETDHADKPHDDVVITSVTVTES